ncbi:MAG: SprT-like domain-containing protein [candidate division Zixibacteria bacterium]|nr:SprT-like domain-containing protein [candidate division Zixibacteria bacterium]
MHEFSSLLAKTFRELDIQLFQGRLADVRVEFSERMTSAAGRYFSRRKLIRLSAPYLRLHGWEKCRTTLIHEMIHAYLDVQGKPCGHTPEFRRLLKMLTGETSIYHREDMSPYARRSRHLYECPNGHRMYRKNRIRRTVSCGICARKFDPRYLIRYVGRVEETS